MSLKDHPLRYKLANELHARPFPAIEMPCSALFLAIKQPVGAAARDRDNDLEHLIALLDRYGTAHPQPGATHYYGQIGRHALKWEQHTEFVTYTVFLDNLSARPFDPTEFEVFPADWLAQAPGVRVTSVQIRIAPWNDDAHVAEEVSDWFVPESLAVARVLDDGAVVAGDYRIDPSGHLRFAVFVAGDTGARRIGRIVQRLCEIETYKSLAMLGFAQAREMSARMGEIDDDLSNLMVDMRDTCKRSEDTLVGLLAVSAELEEMGARASFRFGASRAYETIVNQRIDVLREVRFQGRLLFAEFMLRRFDPAMRTVESTSKRLKAMADRAMRAGELLRTRVDVERSEQNQKLLESMDARADQQLKLQKTVEGLSVVAISYYAVSLASYAAYPLTDVLGISKGMITAILTVPVVLLVWGMIRRIHHKM